MPLRSLCLVAACLLLAPLASAAEPEVVELLADSNLSQWRKPTGEWLMVGEVSLSPADAKSLTWKPGRGVAVNGAKGRTVELATAREFGDVEVHVEFLVAAHSNSGVYFMERYEIQVYDSFGVAKDKYPGIECGGIYPRWINNHEQEGHSPRVNASLPPGQWQSFDVVFRAPRFDASGRKTENARFVRVVHNGKVIHENVEVTGATRAGLEGPEKAIGSLRFQGDHGPVAYRNIRVRPLVEDPAKRR